MAEEAPQETEKLVDNLTNLDTARMTVRWALERIRFLEQANQEMLGLLRQAREAKDTASKELEDARRSADKRLSTISQKERFVVEMQGMLNSLFKGEIDIKDVLEAKTKLEEHKAEVEAKAVGRVAEADARNRKDSEEFQRRLVEMEAGYARALGDADRRYQEQLQDFQRQRHEETLESQNREARFKEKLIEEVQKQADQYHQKLSLLQFEFSQKRQDLQKEYEELKEKLFQEAKNVEVRQSDTFRMAREHWDAERKRLQDLVSHRETELQRQHETIQATIDRLKREQVVAIGAREDELRALEARLRQELSQEQAKREAELRAFEERVALDSHEAQVRENRRVDSANKQLEDERQRHRDELASLQASFDSRLALAVQEHVRMREDELTKRLDSDEKHEADYQSRLARATQDVRDRMTQVEARAEAEVQAIRADNRRMLEEQAARHLRELETARSQSRGFEDKLEASLTAERERGMKSLAEQARKDREVFDGLDTELRREIAAAHAEIQRLTETHTTLQHAALDQRTKLREALERQLAEQTAAHEAMRKDLETRIGQREALWHAEEQKRAARYEQDAAERAKLTETSLQERIKALEDETRRISSLRLSEMQEAANRVKLIQDRFEEKLVTETQTRSQLLQKQWESDKAGLEHKHQLEKAELQQKAQAQLAAAEQKFLADRTALERKAQTDRAILEEKASADLLAAEGRASKAKAEGAAAERTLILPAAAVAAAEKAGLSPQSAHKTLELPPVAVAFSGGSAAPRFRIPWLKILGSLLVLALGGAGIGGGWYMKNKGKDYALPFAHPSGLVWQGDMLWATDSVEQAVYQLEAGEREFTVRQKFPLPGVKAIGLAVAKDKLFVIDGASGQIQRRALNPGLTLQGTSASPGPKPSALYFDGQHLWSADKGSGMLYQHADDETLSVLRSYKLGSAPASLQAVGDHWWWVDADDMTFSRHAAPPGLSLDTSYVLPELQALGKPVTTFSWKGEKIWVGIEGEARLLERPSWRLKPVQ